jgi:hypothetical protein
VKILSWLINGMLPSFSSTTPIIYKREVKRSQNQIPLPRQGTVAGRRSAGNETNWLWNPSMGLWSISYISVPCVGFDATLRVWFAMRLNLNFNFFNFVKIECSLYLYFLYRFDVLMSKIIFKK